MANVLDAMTIRFEGDINPLRDALRQAEQSVSQSSRGIEGSLGRIDAKIGQLRNVVLGYMSVDFAQHLYRQGRAAIEAAGGLGELAEASGIAAKDLQLLIAVGATAGAKVEDITTGVGRFSKSLATAATQGGEMAKAFNKLGVATVATGGGVRDTMAVLLDTASALQKIESPAERVRVAMELFGRGGAKLLPILSQGRQGLDDFAKTAQKMGLILSDETVKAADDAADKLALLDLKSDRLTQRIATALMPAIVDLTIKFKEWIAALVEGPTAIQRIEDRIQALTRDAEKLNRMTGLTGGNRSAIADLEEQRRRLSQAVNTPVVKETPTDPGRLAGRGENDPIKKMIEQLRDQTATAGLTDELDAKVLRNVLAAKRAAENTAVPVTDAEIRKIEELTRALDEREKATGRVREATKKFEDALDAEDQQFGRSMITARAVIAQKYELDNAVQQEIENNKALIAAQQVSNEAYRIEATYQQLVAQYRRQNIPLTEENIAALRREAETLGQQANQLDEIKQRQDALRDSARDFANAIGTAFEDAVIRGNSLRDVMKGLFEDIQRIILRATFTKPLETLLTSAMSGVAAPAGSLGIFGLLGGGGAAGGGAGSGLGALSVLGGLSSLYSGASNLFGGGLSNLWSMLPSSLTGGAISGALAGPLGGLPTAGSMFPSAIGDSGAVGLGGFGWAGPAGAAAALAGHFIGGRAGNALSFGGAGLGLAAALGAGPFGLAAGAIGGGILGGLFGGKPSVGPNGGGGVTISGGQFVTGTIGADNGFNPSGITGRVDALVGTLNRLISMPGVTFNPGAFRNDAMYGIYEGAGGTGNEATVIQNLVAQGVINADPRIIAGAINGKLEEAAAQVQASGLVQTLQSVFQAATQAAQALDSVSSNLQQAADAMKLDQNLSPLKPEEMLASGRSQFETLRIKALSGDTEAAAQLPSVGRALLAVSQDYFGRASGAYGADFRNVENELSTISGEYAGRAASARAIASEAEAAANSALVANTLAAVGDLAGKVDRLTSRLTALTETLR